MNSRRRVATLTVVAMLSALAASVGVARADVGTFSNTTSISIPDIGQGFPYPTNIAVTGLNGVVSDVNATLVSIDHPNPDDIEVLLVGPAGTTTALIGDAGGAANTVNDTITLDDSSALLAPDSGGFVGGVTYRPADYDMPGLDAFNSPAPSPPYGLTLSTHNGTNPNGTWSLYVFDDFFGGMGTGGDISGGWSVNVTTSTAPGVVPPGFPPGTCAGVPVTIGGTAGNDALTGTAGADVIAVGAGSDVIRALGGNDIVCGGLGKDRLVGGTGGDKLLGEKGNDTLKAGPGKDKLKGGPAADLLKGGPGRDTLKGGPGRDVQIQ
jgi:Ca2+-binding RTX toxin-like protein